MNFINENKIKELLRQNKNTDSDKIKQIIKKSKNLKGINLTEVATLLQCEDKELISLMLNTAKYIKEQIYGNRLVLFAPLYLTNNCNNNCLYCAFRKDNKYLKRSQLTQEQIKKEVEELLKEGHKRLLVVAGENSNNIDYTIESIKTIYETKLDKGEIRRINVNIAPLPLEQFQNLKKAGIGTYQLFQETYHLDTYKKVHPSGPKADYENRLLVMDRAMQAGIDDVGIGVLFGLYNYKFETLALLMHCQHLEEKFGVGPHTLSIPRIEPALNAPMANNIPYPVSDQDFKKLVAILRIAVPYTGMILSTRESADFRDEVIDLGISQISAGSRTNPGAYTKKEQTHTPNAEQFSLSDTRTQAEVISDILDKGYLPSFCTACYRTGRTGHDFMELAKPGEIKNFCIPNCILTFKEYLLDYGTNELKKKGNLIIQKEIKKITNQKIKEKTIEKLDHINQGKRDLYF